jgi:hypothetical protein
MVTEENKMTKEFPYDMKKKIKALQDLDKHPVTEVVSWVVEALNFQYPSDHKRAYEIVTKMNWSDIKAEIIRTVESQNYEKIHALAEGMLSARLLNMEVIKHMNRPRDLGNLAVFYDKPNIRLLICLNMINREAKDPKLETYILYRYLTGKPRLSNGFLNKF